MQTDVGTRTNIPDNDDATTLRAVDKLNVSVIVFIPTRDIHKITTSTANTCRRILLRVRVSLCRADDVFFHSRNRYKRAYPAVTVRRFHRFPTIMLSNTDNVEPV